MTDESRDIHVHIAVNGRDWVVRRDGSGRALRRFKSKRAAIAWAVRNAAVNDQLVIHRPDGTVMSVSGDRRVNSPATQSSCRLTPGQRIGNPGVEPRRGCRSFSSPWSKLQDAKQAVSPFAGHQVDTVNGC